MHKYVLAPALREVSMRMSEIMIDPTTIDPKYRQG
jgi:hypothetical protein